jgi:uncharacterized RDD family membrane protein YckC
MDIDRSLYGGFWRRFAALVLDSLIMFVPMFVVFALVEVGFPQWAERDWSLNLLSMVATWLYFALTHSSSAQASPGQRALNLKLTDLAGNRILPKATDVTSPILSGLTLGIGYLLNLFRQDARPFMTCLLTLVYRSEVNCLRLPIRPHRRVSRAGRLRSLCWVA